MSIELLSIDLSNYCTKNCPFCYNHSSPEGNILWKPQEVISFALDCVSHGVKAVSLGGGEAFEYDGIFEIIDVLVPKAYLSVTSNGLPLGTRISWEFLAKHHPDKIHLSLHNPENEHELNSIIGKLKEIERIGIKPGCNLLVSASNTEKGRMAYLELSKTLLPEQIIIIPKRYIDTPTPEQLAYVSDGKPFQSPSCILGCCKPAGFASVSWDKKVNFCSYASGKVPLDSLDFNGMINALKKVEFKTCTPDEDI